MKYISLRWTSHSQALLFGILALISAVIVSSEALQVKPAEGLALQEIRDDFESGDWRGGSGWSGDWSVGGGWFTTAVTTGSAQSGNRQAQLVGNGTITRRFSLSGSTKATLSYWAKTTSFESGDRALVQVSTNGSSWTTLRTHSGNTSQYAKVTVDLSGYAGSASVYLRFAGQMDEYWDVFNVDTVSITMEEAAPPPPTQTATPTPTKTPTPLPTQTPTSTPPPAGTGAGSGGSSAAVSEGFESGNWSGGTGWTNAWSRSGSASYTAVTSGGAQAGTRQAEIRANASITRGFSLAGKASATLTYWAKASSFESGDRAVVQVSGNGSSWTTVQTHADGQDDNRYRQFSVDLGGFAGDGSVFVRFAGQMNASSDYFYVDSIEISASNAAPVTPSPTASPTPPPSATVEPSGPQLISGGLKVDGKSGTVIENVHITSTSGPCLEIRNSQNVTIRNAEIGPCGGNGIVISDSSGVSVHNSFVHPEFHSGTCCDKGNGIFAFRSSGIVIQDSVVAYGESNIELLGVRNARVLNNYLVNPVGPFPRGAQVQVWSHQNTRSSDVRVEGNYAVASRDSRFAHAEGQTDAFNFGFVDGVVVKGNYITGGRFPSGCAVIADQDARNVQILDNMMYEVGQCGVGIAGGSNVTIRGNNIYSNGISGNAGNVAMYVWNQYAEACGSVEVSGNTAVLIRPDGSYQWNSFWNGGGCQLTLGTNVFGQKALDALTPAHTKMPAPANVWSHWLH